MAFDDIFDDILQDPRKKKVTEREKTEGVFDTGQKEDIWRTDIDPDTVFVAGTDDEIHETMPAEEEKVADPDADTEELDLEDIFDASEGQTEAPDDECTDCDGCDSGC